MRELKLLPILVLLLCFAACSMLNNPRASTLTARHVQLRAN